MKQVFRRIGGKNTGIDFIAVAGAMQNGIDINGFAVGDIGFVVNGFLGRNEQVLGVQNALVFQLSIQLLDQVSGFISKGFGKCTVAAQHRDDQEN